MELPYYPINDTGPLMKGMLIGGLGIFHVFLAQFAIGGGMLMCYFQWLAQSGRVPQARRFLEGYFKFLVLVSFVLGALTGDPPAERDRASQQGPDGDDSVEHWDPSLHCL